MKIFFRNRWPLLLVLVVFVILKVPHLSYPFYWDESWPYATAVQHMYDHGISLMPNAIDAEISRGHPLFFHAAAATWMHIFGRSNFALHSFALFISILFLIAIYEVGLRLFNQRTAILALLLTVLQVVFFVQSSFLLFDMLVAFLAFLAIYLYISEKYLLTALILTILFYTKESGLIAGFVIGIDAWVCFFKKKEPLKLRLAKLLVVAVPVLLVSVHFVLQYKAHGWFMLPLYKDSIEHTWGAFWYKFHMTCIPYTFHEDYRNYFLYTLLVLSVIAAIKNKNLRYLILFIPAILIYYWVDDMRSGRIPSRPAFALFIAAAFYAAYLFNKMGFFESKKQYRLIVLLTFFAIAFLCFSAMNFLTYRYLLSAIIPVLFIVAVYIDKLIDRSFRFLIYPSIIVMLFCGYYVFVHDTGWGDCDLGAFKAMDVEQKVVDYMVRHNLYNKAIASHSFQTREHLIDPYTGFLHNSPPFTKVKWEIDDSTNIVIFDNIEPDYPERYANVKADTSFHLLYRPTNGPIWSEIYGRIR